MKISQTRHPSATKINPPSHNRLINKNKSTDSCSKTLLSYISPGKGWVGGPQRKH